MKAHQTIWQAGLVALIFGAANLHGQNVGIGFSIPASKLTVNGNFAVGADFNAAAPTNGAIIEGNVGIGTTSPARLKWSAPWRGAALVRCLNDLANSDPASGIGKAGFKEAAPGNCPARHS